MAGLAGNLPPLRPIDANTVIRPMLGGVAPPDGGSGISLLKADWLHDPQQQAPDQKVPETRRLDTWA